MQCIIDHFHSIQSWDTFTLLEGACSHSRAIPPPLFCHQIREFPCTKICSRKHLRCEPWLPQGENGQGKKNLQGQEKVREFHFKSGKIFKVIERSQGKVKF